MARRKPYTPQVIKSDGPDGLALGRQVKESVMPLYDTKGFETDTKRVVNVFLSLRNSGTLDGTLSALGVNLMTLYAKANGVAGADDQEFIGAIQHDDRVNVTWRAYIRSMKSNEARLEYAKTMASVGHISRHILTALCYEWFFGEGRAKERANGRREASWRSVVRDVYKEQGMALAVSNQENVAVWVALMDLKNRGR